MRRTTLELGDFSISGISRSAYETYIKFNELNCAFDIGKSAEAVVNKDHIFISHIHLDHCAGLVHNLASRKLQRLPKVNVYIPEYCVEEIQSIISLWEKLENAKFNYSLIPLEHNGEYSINKNLMVRAFSVQHKLPTYGFELYERRKKLKQEYLGLSSEQIIELKKKNTDLFYTLHVNKCMYTSDTTIQTFEKYPELLDAHAVISECTFIFETHEQIATDFEHIHFQQLLPYIQRFRGEHFVLCHFSMRYSREDIYRFFEEKREEYPSLKKVKLFV